MQNQKKNRWLWLVSLLVLSAVHVAWESESGSGVVSDAAVIVRTSLEATEVLRSGTLGLLYGENRFGGATNYSSTDSGGVYSTRNVTSSEDVVRLGNGDFLAWLTSTGVSRHMGLSADNAFVLPIGTNIFGHARVTIASDATSFSAAGGQVFVTSTNTTPTAITAINDAQTNKIFYVIGGSNVHGTSINDAAPFSLSANIRLSRDDVLVLMASPDGTFVELDRSDN